MFVKLVMPRKELYINQYFPIPQYTVTVAKRICPQKVSLADARYFAKKLQNAWANKKTWIVANRGQLVTVRMRNLKCCWLDEGRYCGSVCPFKTAEQEEND